MKKIGRYIGDANYLNEKSSVGFFPYNCSNSRSCFLLFSNHFIA